MMREYTAKEEGYVFMYVSNENATLVDVYFDDVVMTRTRSNLIQYNEYYPFGLQTANSWTRENTTVNNFLANGGTELNQATQVYDLDFRNYDPALGRMNQIDPMASKYSSLTPYNYSFNDPVTFTDVNGADPTTVNYSASNSQYYTMYTYDDRIDYHWEAVGYNCGSCWRSGESANLYASATGYGGSVSSMVSSWAPNFGGPVAYTNALGETAHAFPTTLEWASRQQARPYNGYIESPGGTWSGYVNNGSLEWHEYRRQINPYELTASLGGGMLIQTQGGDHWWFDDQGEVLFNHWRNGNRAELFLDDPKFWGDYMRAHSGLRDAIEQEIASKSGGKSGAFNGVMSYDFGGGYRTGYQLLGGSNAFVGGLSYSAYVSVNGNEVNYQVNLMWNDIMDAKDSWDDRLGVSLFPGTPYTVHVSWSYDFTFYKF
jgi:RHS repeat-associated protein